MPSAVLAVVEDHLCAAVEGLLERGERRPGRATQLRVGVSHEPQPVVVEPEPHVQAVLLDPVAGGGVAAAGALSTEPPAELVDRDVEALLKLGGGGQLECGG